jgi:UPF0755 protein
VLQSLIKRLRDFDYMGKKIGIIAFLIVGAMLLYLKRSEIMFLLRGGQKTINQTEVKLLITEDLSVEEMAQFLIEKGILESPKSFVREAKKMNIQDGDFDAGKYTILSGTKIKSLINGFTRAENGHGKNEEKVKIIFNRCKTIEDIGMNIAKCIQADSTSIVEYVNSPTTLQKYGFTKAQIPALFLPDEYEMYYDTNAEEFVSFMAEQFKSFWTEERKSKLKAIGLEFPSQAATLASIVYSEQGKVSEEWPIIARLYLNRLKQNMKLQSDPTFKFCWGSELNNVQRLRAKHRDIDCEYNTYKINGLPPGPIAIVPAKVIDSVLSPDSNNFLFMCAKPDYSGEHNFTHSDVVHVRNASEYQKWLTKEGKK